MDNFNIGWIPPQDGGSIIKVIGVGGGGNNAVNHMYRSGIKDVTFVVCNTDNQALQNSPIEKKVQLGPTVTAGLGAGNNPEVARLAAEESIEDIKALLEKNTKMVFVTAGMGGGTGTGAAPVVARIAKEMNILTVGIVTVPFVFEGKIKMNKAFEGIRRMKKNVDALLVISNERLYDIYPELNVTNAFAKADDVLKDAAKGIAEIITIHGHINVDFADVNTIMRNSGVAIMNTGYASGDNRISKAIDNAIKSPLLKERDARGAKKILMNLYCSQEHDIKVEEVKQINQFMDSLGNDVEEMIWGICHDDTLGEEVKITLIATGFGMNDVSDMPLEKENPVVETPPEIPVIKPVQPTTAKPETNREIDDFEEYYGHTLFGQKEKEKEKAKELVELSNNLDDEKIVDELEKQPAFERKANSGGIKPFVPRNLK